MERTRATQPHTARANVACACVLAHPSQKSGLKVLGAELLTDYVPRQSGVILLIELGDAQTQFLAVLLEPQHGARIDLTRALLRQVTSSQRPEAKGTRARRALGVVDLKLMVFVNENGPEVLIHHLAPGDPQQLQIIVQRV
eukprot:CAMPEP_0175476910 /NCGR_PEP_ID=MMETSP0095-20121207/76167_1 /TAXON_ID=311494 /ORGANISM="Alexandrium monilatum, Strain CCMP3105" /LENGTH=140 /DNA_ID=CAMNT_0016778505 /DNA_START=98 /DNA_END=520 /DNA_ORIENTATION=+